MVQTKTRAFLGPNPYPGIFIAIEGLDGAGKTTQVNLLRDSLGEISSKAFVTKEPTDN